MGKGLYLFLFAMFFTVKPDLIETVMKKISALLAYSYDESKNMCAGENLGDVIVYDRGVLKVSSDGGDTFKEEQVNYGMVIGMSCETGEDGHRKVLITALNDKGEPSLFVHHIKEDDDA